MSGKNRDNPGMETLSGVDGAFLNLETAATPMHVGSLHLFEVPAGYRGSFFATVRRMMESRMVPVLRRRLATLPLHLANPVWLQGEVDLGYHIRRVRVPAPGTWAQLEAVVADLHAELLDRSRPLWMMYVFDGLEGNARAYYFKIHHAMLDGQAGVALAGALFDTSPDPEPQPKARRAAGGADNDMPGTLTLAAAAFRHDAAQYIKLVRELPDVVLALCSGALRRYLKRTAAIPRKSLIASMPISLREPGNTEMRTQATLSLVSLATNVADPIKRLLAIRDSSGATKAVARSAKSVIPTDFPLIGVPWILGALASLYGRSKVVDTLPVLANVLVSNVPGPPVPLYVGGLRMSGYWPLSIVEHGVGLNITLISYAGTLFLGFVVARNAVPDPRALAEDFLAAFEELKQHMLKPASHRKAVGGRKSTGSRAGRQGAT